MAFAVLLIAARHRWAAVHVCIALPNEFMLHRDRIQAIAHCNAITASHHLTHAEIHIVPRASICKRY
jgi:hypothetical protein